MKQKSLKALVRVQRLSDNIKENTALQEQKPVALFYCDKDWRIFGGLFTDYLRIIDGF